MDTGSLAEAIRRHQVVELSYLPDPSGRTRTVHPHALFRAGNGGLCVDALQVAGATRSGRLPAWRQFRLMEIRDVRLLDSRFEPDPDFVPGSEKYRHGLIAVA